MPVARRLRFLRGDETQTEFAKRLGVSRSALAIYDTGRSKPDDFTLSRICERLGLAADFFAAPSDPMATKSFQAIWGQAIEGQPDWTGDEALIIRMIRLCDENTIKGFLRDIADNAVKAEVVVTLGKIFDLQDDFQRLLELAEGMRHYEKGPQARYLEESRIQHLGFKKKTGASPK